MNRSEKTRLLIIGIDGATFDLLLPWAGDGSLPNLARLVHTGAHGPLRSTLPVLTAPAWVSSYTGVNPGKHGIYDFYRVDSQQNLRLNTTRDVRAPFYWQFMNRQGISTGLVSAPMTYPPQPLKGFWVSGAGTPWEESHFTFPDSLREELMARFGYKVRYDRLVLFYGTYRERLIELKNVMDLQARAAERLLKTLKPDVFFFVFDHVDVIQHFFWRFMDETHPRHRRGPFRGAIREFMRGVDAHIGRLIEAAAPDAGVVVYSDHGFGPLHYDVCVNKLLADAGMMAVRNTSAAIREQTRVFLLRRLYKAAYRLGLRPKKKTPETLVPDADAKYIDWSRTRAYFPTLTGQQVRLNLAGREPGGIVRPGREAERTIQELKRIFADAKAPETGEKIVFEAYEPHEIYSGPQISEAPDLILEVNPKYCMQKGFSRRMLSKSNIMNVVERSGDHRREGIVIVNGPGIRSGVRLPQSDIMDVAPTLLHLAGAPVPAYMEGKVITDAFEKEPDIKMFDYDFAGEKGEAGSTEVYTEEEENAVKDQLRGLGYM